MSEEKKQGAQEYQKNYRGTKSLNLLINILMFFQFYGFNNLFYVFSHTL